VESWDREVQRRGAPSGSKVGQKSLNVCDDRHTVRILRHPAQKRFARARTTDPGSGPASGYSFSSTIALIGLLPEAASSSENSTRTVSPS
jgi:hypothetical protein